MKRVEYIWLDGDTPLPKLRSKTKYVDISGGVPSWNFDGGSTKQGTLSDSDRNLTCVRTYEDPFNEGGYLALCEVFYQSVERPECILNPHESNMRRFLSETVEDCPGILVGFEQEFTLMDARTNDPLGFALAPKEQGQYYCGVGRKNIVGRFLIDEFEARCVSAGIDLYGVNAEVMPGQWEFQTNAADPVKAADDLWVCRYILDRITENMPILVSYDPKPHEAFNGAGCHTNISTERMRESFREVDYEGLLLLLKGAHKDYIKVCGEGLDKRLTGDCETSDYMEFSWGIGDRGASVRIPTKVYEDGAGYIEDRRPCANIDPYQLLFSLISTIKESDLSRELSQSL
jgi:glutamine synthetase